MPNLIVHSGPLGNYYFFQERIRQSVKAEKADFLAIVPVNRAVRIFKRQLIAVSPNRTLIDPAIFTFNELLLEIYRRLPGAKRVISNDMLLLIVEHILSERKSELGYLTAGQALTAGVVKRTTAMVNELRRFGYHGENFSQLDIADKSHHPLKYNDFELILKALDEKLGEQLIDESFAQHSAAQMLTQKSFQAQFAGVKTIYINGYGLFSPAMYKFVEKTSQWAEVNLKLEYCSQNPLLFSHTAEALQRLRSLGAVIIESKTSSLLATQLFNRKRKISQKSPMSARIEVQGLKNREEEVAYICAKIRALHLTDNLSFQQMAVTFSNLERYVPLIRQQFRKYGIPFNLSTGFNLNQSPLIRLFLNCLQLIENNFEFTAVCQLLNSSFIKKADHYNPHLTHKIFVENRLRYLSKESLHKLLIQFANKKADGETDLTEFNNPYQQIRMIGDLLDLFFSFPGKATALEFRSAYIQLLKKLNLLNWYQKPNVYLSHRQQENEFRAYNRFMKVLDKMIWMLHFIHGSQQFTLTKFINYLQILLDRVNYNLAEWPEYGVQVMPRLEIQALPFTVLFIGGLVDGEFPRASVKDVFFNDSVRAKMGLLASEELLDQDRFIYYALLDSAAEKIVQTYPQYENDRALVPSTFISDLQEFAVVRGSEEVDHDFLLNKNNVLVNVGFDIQNHQFDKATQGLDLIRIATKNTFADTERRIIWLIDRIDSARQRIIGTDFSKFEGNLSSIESIQNWLKDSYGKRSWSITRLEEYAFCPMQFFLDQILKIKELPTYEEELTSLERGIVIHEILFKFYSELGRRKQSAFPAAHRDLLFNIAQEVFERLPFRGFFWDLERSVYFGSDRSRGFLETFLEYDQSKIDESGYVPALFEYAFGYTSESEKDQLSQPGMVLLKSGQGQIAVSGKIDRIDINSQRQALIFDYKTGYQSSNIKASQIKNGLSFQLPLYMLALAELEKYEPVYAGYYLVKDTQNCQRRDVIADREIATFVSNRSQAALPNNRICDDHNKPLVLEELLKYSLDQAIDKVRELTGGHFNHTRYPDEPGCERFCEFRRICQKNVSKLKRINEKGR